MKYVFFVAGLIILIAVGVFFWNKNLVLQTIGWVAASDFKNIVYQIEGQEVKLANGTAEPSGAAGSSSKTVTKYFGNEAVGDFNEDGQDDIAFILTQETGGSGVFYYAVAALKTDKGYVGTNAVFIGDRIAPQTTEFRDGIIIVNYADRLTGEPMTAAPSLGSSLRLRVVDGKLIRI